MTSGAKKALYSTDEGYAVANGNDFGDAKTDFPEGSLTAVDYNYDLIDTDSVRASVEAEAGATLTFE